MRFLIVLLTIALCGCPKECKTQADCGRGETCQAYNLASDSDDAPRRYACVPDNVGEGDTFGGVRVSKCDVGTSGVNCTVEPAR